MSQELYRSMVRDLEFLMLKGVKNISFIGETIAKTHQVFPDRLLASHPEVDVIVLDYTVGTGKTNAAIVAIIRTLAQARELTRISSRAKAASIVPRPYVVGTWATIQAFEHEFLKSVFGIVTASEENAMKTLEGEDRVRLRRKLLSRIRDAVNLMTYQKFFNFFFRGSINLVDKSDAAIVEAIRDGRVYLNTEVLGELQNSILVIDELHNLYSSSGMNTYGQCVMHIRQSPLISGLTLMGLTGTLLNRSMYELLHLYNIIRPQGAALFKHEDYIDAEQISRSQTIIRLKPSKREELLKFSEGKFATYSQSHSEDFPDVFEAGELIRSKRIRFKWFKLVRCHSSPEQWRKYKEVRDQLLVDDDEDNEPLHGEIYIPPKDQWATNDIKSIPGRTNILTGNYFKLNNLRKWGAVPARFIDDMHKMFKSGKREKVAGYHRRIRKMGIYQYTEILNINGFIPFEETPKINTLCIVCGKPNVAHVRSTKHAFVAARYAMLIGDFPTQLRERIINLWNSPDNIYGEKAILLLLSSIAEIGITFLDTMHLYLLGSVPHISRFLQIRGRLARFRSHIRSPPNRRTVTTHTLILSAPKRLSRKGVLSAGEILYYTKETNDLEITSYLRLQKARSINCQLHSELNPTRDYRCKYVHKIPKTPSTHRYKTLYSMMEQATISMSLDYMLTRVSPVWYVSEVRAALHANKYMRLPWATQFIEDQSIVSTLWEMHNAGDIMLMSMRRRVDFRLTIADIKSDEIIVLKRPKKKEHSIPFNLFSTIIPTFEVAPVPLTNGGGATELEVTYDELKHMRGLKNKIDAVNTMIVYTEFIKIAKRDYLDKGPLYRLFKDIGALTFVNDDKSHIDFVKNRLPNVNPTANGFLLGPEWHSYDSQSKTWSKEMLPSKPAPNKEEWEYIGIFSPGSAIAPGKWLPRFRLRPRLRKITDQRAQKIGMGCRSIERLLLINIYRKIVNKQVPNQKEDMCKRIRACLLAKQLKIKVRTIYTLFEHPKIHLTSLTIPTEIEAKTE